jgi:hypothetical protein
MSSVLMSSTIVTVIGTNSTSDVNSTIASGQSLVFDPTGNDNLQFATTPSTNQTDTGFTFFGAWLLWKSNAGVLGSSWYATPTGTNGTYTVQWLEDTTDVGTSVPISLKWNSPGNLAKIGARRA